jgi:oxaloacetate decarboxylase alpha subunit
MSKKNLPIEEINELAAILKDQELTEIEVESDKWGRIKVRKEVAGSNSPIMFGAGAPAMPASGGTTTNDSSSAVSANANLVEITSPMVGTFYASPSPEAEPFVKAGDSIKPGDTLCIIEAMKLMNELPAELDGKVVEIKVANGEAIAYGDVIMTIEKA